MEAKKVWNPPSLTVYGTVEKMTQQDKQLGSTDGFTFMGQNITNNS